MNKPTTAEKVWVEKQGDVHVLVDLENTVRPATRIEIILADRLEAAEAETKTEFDIATGYHRKWQKAESTIRAMKPYIRHKESCRSNYWLSESRCECGFKELKALLDKHNA